MSGSRQLEKAGKNLMNQTPSLDHMYMARKEEDTSCWYKQVSTAGFVPIISGTGLYDSWPIQEEYAQIIMLLS